MTVAKVDDVFQPAESRMYRFALTDNKLSSLPECAAEGYAIGMTIVREPCLCAFCGSSQEAPDLVRLTKAGSSKVFMENVV